MSWTVPIWGLGRPGLVVRAICPCALPLNTVPWGGGRSETRALCCPACSSHPAKVLATCAQHRERQGTHSLTTLSSQSRGGSGQRGGLWGRKGCGRRHLLRLWGYHRNSLEVALSWTGKAVWVDRLLLGNWVSATWCSPLDVLRLDQARLSPLSSQAEAGR